MKIRTQDALRCVEFGDCYVAGDRTGISVFVRTPNNPDSIHAGSYEDEERAKGVIQEIGQAYSDGTKLFYMPVK